MSARDIQIGGEHYKKYAIQPVEILDKIVLPYSLSAAIKYMRHADKNGLEDIRKAYHCVLLYRENPHGKKLINQFAHRVVGIYDEYFKFADQFGEIEELVIIQIADDYLWRRNFNKTLNSIALLYKENGGNIADLPEVA